MAVFRVDRTADYTVMSNTHFREKTMSLKAKGLLSLMLSLPDDWDYSIEGLVAICKESETAIKSTLNELKEFGYLEIIKLLPNQTGTGRIDYVYQIYERPQKQEGEKQGVENLGVEFLGVENQAVEIQAVENVGQLNTNILNNKKENTKELNTKKQKAVYFDNEALNDAFKDFIKMRNKIKKPMTDNAIKRAINKLNKLAGTDDDMAIQIVNQSVDHCWQDFYPLKGDAPIQNSTGNAFIDKWATV